MGNELSEAVSRYLSEVRFAVLATQNRDGTLQQSVVWYEMRDGQVMINTRRGRRKDRNIRRLGRASICVHDGYRYVAIEGPISIVDDQSVTQADIRALAVRYNGEEAAERAMESQFSRETRVTLILEPFRVDAYGFSS